MDSRTKIPPTRESVEEYAKSIQYNLDVDAFCDFYEMKGWIVGRTKMKDWQAAVRTWQRRDAKENPPEKTMLERLEALDDEQD